MSVRDILGRTRFNPNTIFLLLALALAVAYVALGGSLLRQHSKQSELSSQINSAEAVLATSDDVRRNLEDLPARLTETRQELAAAQLAFPSVLDGNAILETVVGLAAENQVRVISLYAAPPSAESTEDGNTGGTLSFDLEVDGDFAQLIALLEALEEGATSTTRVSNFALERGGGRYLLDLELVAHARSLPADPSSSEGDDVTDEETEPAEEGEETPSE